MENKNDCCKEKIERSNESNIKYYFVIAIVTLILLISVVQSFQIRSIKESLNKNMITGNAVANSGGLDLSGWTEDEKMMYEHHGTLPARLQKNTNQKTGSGMVGGC